MLSSVLHPKLSLELHTQMDPPGFEPGASALQGQRYTGLSHRPITILLCRS